MPDIQILYSRYRKYMFYLLAVFVFGWGFTSYKEVFLGFILGTAISFINLWLLYKKTIRMSEAVAKGKAVYSIGSLSRFAYAALGILIAIQFPNDINILSTLIGLLTSYIVMALDSFVLLMKKGYRKRGE